MKSRYIMDSAGFLRNNGRSWLPIMTVILFVMLASLSIVRIFYQVKTSSEQVIIQEISEVARVITRIDEDCRINRIDQQKTAIDFLNVVKFVGSEVGSINLTYPEKWMGPYMKDNPTIQMKEYQIVRTKKGYFVTPGDGVELRNGKIIGKDIVLDEHADIEAMMKDENLLNYKGNALAVKLDIMKSPLQQVLFENVLRYNQGL